MSAKVKFERGAYWVVVHHAKKRRKRRVGPTKADKKRAEGIAEDINHRLALGLHRMGEVETPALPFDQQLRKWLRTYSPTFKRSFERNAGVQIEKHLVPFFGSKDLASIREEDLLAYIRLKIDAGFSRSTIQNGLSIVRRVFNLALRESLVSRNPAARIGELLRRVDRRVATEVKQIESWTREEVETILSVAREREERVWPALVLLFSTGIRRGELLGLKWEDVDFQGRRLTIRRAIVEGQLTTPKSGKSRSIALPAGAAALLLDVLALRRRECLARGWPETPPWVFCSQTGGPLEARNFSRSWFRVRRLAQKSGVRPFRLHSTRHTYASLALAAGRSVRWVAEQLGHSNPELTLRTYAHVLPSEEADLSAVDFGSTDGPGRHYTAPPDTHPTERESAPGTSTRERYEIVERETGLEPATPSLGSSCSTS